MLDTLLSFAMAVGRRKFKKLVVVENPDGSATAVTMNSAVAGIVRVKRVTARSIVWGPNVARRARFVEMSAVGLTPSSTRLKSGARPSVALKRSLFASAVMVQPWSGEWQVAHVRGFEPSAAKKGVVRSIEPAV